MENKLKAQIINFDKKEITNNKTGEVSVMYEVNFGVQTAPIKNHYGLVLLTSYCSEDAFEKLKSNLNKLVDIVLEDKPIYGKSNTYKKIVVSINGYSVRNFNN